MSDSETPVYLDYAATTPVDPRVAETMSGLLTQAGIFGNPASGSHRYGWAAKGVVEQARSEVAGLIKAHPSEIVWTSGATESDNLAIKGAARGGGRRGAHLVTCSTEHPAVLDSCRQLEREGFDVTYLYPEPDGLIDLQKFQAALRDDTVLASIMHVNNEIGVIQDIDGLGRVCRQHGVLLHVDAAQSAGKIAIDLQRTPVDLMSFSAHKVYGPKGVGALYVRTALRQRIEPQMHGGGQEQGLRAGTLATHQIAGMGAAFRIAQQEWEAESRRLRNLRERLWEGLRDLGGVRVNGDLERRVAGNLHLSFDGVDGSALLAAMDGVAASAGSACNSSARTPSHVLKALGCSDETAQSSIRFSLGRFTTAADIDAAVQCVRTQVVRLRRRPAGSGQQPKTETSGSASQAGR